MATVSVRHAGPRDIADCLGSAASLGVRRRAFQQAQLMARWPEIVGAKVARHCQPVGLSGECRPAAGRSGGRKSPAGGTLELRASSAFAPQLAMLAPELVERVNLFLGGPLVARLRIRHGLVPRECDAPGAIGSAPQADAGDAADRAAADGADTPAAVAPPATKGCAAGMLRAIADPGLRDALARLAASVAASSGPPVFDVARSSR